MTPPGTIVSTSLSVIVLLLALLGVLEELLGLLLASAPLLGCMWTLVSTDGMHDVSIVSHARNSEPLLS